MTSADRDAVSNGTPAWADDGPGAPVSARRPGLPGAPPGSARSPRLGPLQRLRGRIIDLVVERRSRRAEARLQGNTVLWDLLSRAARGTEVTGASYSDYWTLYEQVRLHKPVEILELGTGISTVAMAQALRENEAEGHPRGRVTSMEEDAYWHGVALENLPEDVRAYVEILHSPKVDGFYKCFRGVQYAGIPDRPYDFVFSDGPERHSPVNGDKLFDLDLIHVVRRSDRPVRAIVDNHYLTFYVLQKVFGPKLARYSVPHRLLFIGPVTCADVRFLRHENFLPDLRILAGTVFRLRMSRSDGDS